MINRILEDRVLKVLQHFPAVAILGPRQSGKTTLSKVLSPKIGKETFYLDLENPEDFAVLSEPLHFFRANQDKCIILDEIQRKPELFPILRSVIDENRYPARFVLLGSASTDLLFLSSETLSGRIVYTELSPFVWNEVSSYTTIYNHWIFGGFPQPCLNQDAVFRKEWFKSFILTYVERDFRILGLDSSPSNLSRFFSMMAHLHAGILNKSSLSRSLAINQVTVSKYLSYFQQAFLLRELPAWHQNIGKRLVKSPKIFVRDSGLLHFLLRINNYNEVLAHPVLGSSWEGYIIEQIISSLGDEFAYYYYRTQDGTECDLLLEKSNKPLCAIEIKFTSAPKRSKGFTTAIQDLGTKNNFLIIPQIRQPYSLGTNITVTDLEGFLETIVHNYPES
jgi:predicted AAA+ superfamily ATPase